MINIDNLYSNFDKSNFYLGKVSQVSSEKCVIQVENLSLLKKRNISFEELLPSTINYYVTIDSDSGLFLGEVYKSSISNSDSVHDSMVKGYSNNIYPNLYVRIIGKIGNDGKFSLPGFKNVGIGNKSYVSNDKIKKIYLSSLELNKNKTKSNKIISGFASMINTNNTDISLSTHTLFDRHLMVIGSTNSGKSTSSLSLIYRMIQNESRFIIIDPTGEYNNSFDKMNVQKIILGTNSYIPISDIPSYIWGDIFQVNDNTQLGVLNKAILSLKYKTSCGTKGLYNKNGIDTSIIDKHMNEIKDKIISGDVFDFNLLDLPKQVYRESVERKKKGESFEYQYSDFMLGTNEWLINKISDINQNTNINTFFKESKLIDDKSNLFNQIDNFVNEKDKSIYINASNLDATDIMGKLIIDLICNYVMNITSNNDNIDQNDSIDQDDNGFVLFIDEVHRYTYGQKESKKMSGLERIAREGRKQGIFLFITTQSPKDVPNIILNQVGTLIVHRLTGEEEIHSIINFLSNQSLSNVSNLNTGEAIMSSVNLINDIFLKFNKTKLIHYNDTPSV